MSKYPLSGVRLHTITDAVTVVVSDAAPAAERARNEARYSLTRSQRGSRPQPSKTDAASRSCERERGIPIYTAPDEAPVGADNPEPPAESAGPPGPRGLGCQYGGPVVRFDTENSEIP